MTKKEILEFIKKNSVFALATSHDNIPYVRNMMLYKADETGLIFSTGTSKDVFKQLSANPKVEMCFYDCESECQVRISGRVEPLEDLELKKEIVEAYPFLKPWIEKEGYDVLAVFCLKKAKALVWTMETNSEPKVYIDL